MASVQATETHLLPVAAGSRVLARTCYRNAADRRSFAIALKFHTRHAVPTWVCRNINPPKNWPPKNWLTCRNTTRFSSLRGDTGKVKTLTIFTDVSPATPPSCQPPYSDSTQQASPSTEPVLFLHVVVRSSGSVGGTLPTPFLPLLNIPGGKSRWLRKPPPRTYETQTRSGPQPQRPR